MSKNQKLRYDEKEAYDKIWWVRIISRDLVKKNHKTRSDEKEEWKPRSDRKKSQVEIWKTKYRNFRMNSVNYFRSLEKIAPSVSFDEAM